MSNIAYNDILSTLRFKPESANSDIETSASSDKSRVIFSSSFRRLQQKAQVFGLETNASVRSRLTHTLEVTNTGGLIAKKVASALIKNGKLKEDFRVPFIDLTETCCLLHDVGNPPFGHFGEAAIQKWFKLNWGTTFRKSRQIKKGNPINEIFAKSYINDFLHFDGNPQGVRIILHLQGLPDEYDGSGLNLSYSQILSCVKYIGNPDEINPKDDKYKKAGFFHSEKGKITTVRNELKWHGRFPITYIMEAADDISYCLSDIEDGIEKCIIQPKLFFKELINAWGNDDFSCFGIPEELKEACTRLDFFKFKIRITRNLIERAAEIYVNNQDKIKSGTISELFENDSETKKMLRALKNFARKHLFRSPEAENIELAGYKVIFGLLEGFRPLLELNSANFALLVKAEDDINALSGKKMDIEWRLYNKLPEKHIEAYRFALENYINEDDFE